MPWTAETRDLFILTSGIISLSLLALILLRQKAHKKRTRRILALRKMPINPIVSNKILPRSSDNQLTPEQVVQKSEALQLVQLGRVKEGATLLEAATLNRDAITILEQAGLIDDACAVLMRMQRPGRAGAIFARNGMSEKAAAECVKKPETVFSPV